MLHKKIAATTIKCMITVTVITCILARIASSGVVNTVAETPPSGAAMHCKQSRGTHTGDKPLSIPVTAKKQLHLAEQCFNLTILQEASENVIHQAFVHCS